MVRKHATSIFISPGGKPLSGESDEDCLSRELWEELQVWPVSLSHLATFERKSALEDTSVVVSNWFVQIEGEPRPASEICELAWIDGSYERRGIAVGSVFAECVIPALIERDLVDA